MDTQWVEVLHVADRDTVVVTVANHFIFYLFPPFERFFDQNLGRVGKGFAGQYVQFFVVVAETGAQTSQCVSGTDNHRITQFVCDTFSLSHGGYCFAFDGFDVDLVQFVNELVAVFGVDNGLYRSSQHLYTVFL